MTVQGARHIAKRHGIALCVLLAVLAPALIAMHSLVIGVPASSASESHHAKDAAPCEHEMPCEQSHPGTHACVAVLVDDVVFDADHAHVPHASSLDLVDHATSVLRIDGRWPPWTTPTSAELSIWRV